MEVARSNTHTVTILGITEAIWSHSLLLQKRNPDITDRKIPIKDELGIYLLISRRRYLNMGLHEQRPPRNESVPHSTVLYTPNLLIRNRHTSRKLGEPWNKG
jgi:hypothetical protein